MDPNKTLLSYLWTEKFCDFFGWKYLGKDNYQISGVLKQIHSSPLLTPNIILFI